MDVSDLPVGIVIHDPRYVDQLPIVLTVHESVERLHGYYQDRDPGDALSRRDNWEAVTTPRFGKNRDEELGECVEIHVALDRLWTSIVVHEATHAGLLLYAHHQLRRRRKARAWRHIAGHTEQLPETIGNLSAHLLIVLRDEFSEYLDADEATDGQSTGPAMT